MSVGGEAKVDAAQPRSPQGRLTAPAARRITARWLDITTVLGFAVPVAVYIWFLHHYCLNVVFADQWSDVTLISVLRRSSHPGCSVGPARREPHSVSQSDGARNESPRCFQHFSGGVHQRDFPLPAMALIIAADKRRTPDRGSPIALSSC